MERITEILLKVRIEHERPQEPGQTEDLANDLATAVEAMDFREGLILSALVEDFYDA